MPPDRRGLVQARQAVMRQYDLALCRAATEHKSRESLKEKVHHAARIAVSRHSSGIEVKGFVSRLVDICDDPMAIKENLLLVIDSIMRHAEKEDVSAVRKFEKAFAPHLYTLFGACVKSSENRSQVATYLLKKLVPFWKENAWFSREMPKVIHLLVSKLKEGERPGEKGPKEEAFEEGQAAQARVPSKMKGPADSKLPEAPTYVGTEEAAPAPMPGLIPETPASGIIPRTPATIPGTPGFPAIPPTPRTVPATPADSALIPQTPVDRDDKARPGYRPFSAYKAYKVPVPLVPPPQMPTADDHMSDYSPSVAGDLVPPQEPPPLYDPFAEPPPTAHFSSAAYSQEVQTEDLLLPPGYGRQEEDLLHETPVYGAETPLTQRTGEVYTEIPLPTEVGTKTLTSEVASSQIPTISPHADGRRVPLPGVHEDEQVPVPTEPAPSERFPYAMKEEEVPMPTSPAPSSPGADRRELPVPTSPIASEFGEEDRRLGYGGEDVPVPTSPVASDDGYYAEDVPIPTSPVDSPAGEDRRPAVHPEDREVPVPTSPVQSPADDDEHRPPVVPVSSGHMSSGMLSAQSESADEPTESPSEEVPAPTEVHDGPGEEPPSFEEVEFLLDEAALRNSASASSGIGPVSSVEAPEEVPHPDSALPTSSAPADLFPDDSTEPSSPMQAVNPPTSPVTSPAEEMEFVDEGSAATGLPSGSLFESAKLRESVPVHTSSVYVTSPTEIVPTDLPAPTSPVTSPADEVETQTIREALLPQLQQEVHTEMPVPTEMPSPSAAYDEEEEEIPLHLPPGIVPTEVPSPTSPRGLRPPTTEHSSTRGVPATVRTREPPTREPPTLVPPTREPPTREPMPIPTEVPSETSHRLRPVTTEATTIEEDVTSPTEEVEVQTMTIHAPMPPPPEVHTEMPVPTEMPSPSAVHGDFDEEDIPLYLPDTLRHPPVPVPTEVPSPTSPGLLPRAPTSEPATGSQGRAPLPVPTEVASPTSLRVPVRPPTSEHPTSTRGTLPTAPTREPPTREPPTLVPPTREFMPPTVEVPSEGSRRLAHVTTEATSVADVVTSPADEVETQTIRAAMPPPEVHTEMPVPTEMPSPTAAPPEFEEEEIPLHVPVPETFRHPPVPVPTEVPSPTSPRMMASRPPTSEVPTEPTVESEASLPPPLPRPVPTEVPSSRPPTTEVASIPTATRTHTRTESAPSIAVPRSVPARSVPFSRAVESSPTELPVPTQMPSPTSPGRQHVIEDVDVPTAIEMPTLKAPEEPEAQPLDMPGQLEAPESVAQLGSSVVSSSVLLSASPTEMPVPTEMISPTSLGEEEGEPCEETTAIPTATAIAPTVTAPAPPGPLEEEFPPPMPESAPMTSPIASPSEVVPVGGDAEAAGTQRKARSRRARSSPTEGTVLVPTERPSPSSPVRPPEAVGTLPTAIAERTVSATATATTAKSSSVPTYSEIPVPTERPSPSEIPVGQMHMQLPASGAAASALLGSSVAMGSSAMASGEAMSPTEMPVPTDVPSPTSQSGDEGETVTAPALTAPTLSAERTVTSRHGSTVVLSSPADVPVPTARPSPTSMGGACDDEEEAIVGPLPDAAQEPPEPFVVTSPVESPEQEVGDLEVPAMYSAAAVDASALLSESAPERTPTDLPAMPVPTEVPSPTSLGADEDEEADTVTGNLLTLPTQTLVAPRGSRSAMFGEEETASVPPAAQESAYLSSSAAALPSPTDMPVPTELPSPTSAVSEPAPSIEGLATTAPPPTAPTALLEQAPADADFPPPMPESAPMSTSEVASPSELPVPDGEAPAGPRSLRRHGGVRSPTEMGLPVPTELPSPTERGMQPEVPLPSPKALPPGFPQVHSSAAAVSSSAATQSPSELPVPTERPSPTEMPVPVRTVERTFTHSRPATTAVPSSPADLPVPTARPSPTSMGPGDDEEEAIMGPLPDAAREPPEPFVVTSPVESSPGQEPGAVQVPAPYESALDASGALSESARSPTELPEIAVPTEVPSPTSLGAVQEEADTVAQEIGTLPTQTIVPPTLKAPRDELEVDVPFASAVGESAFMSSSGQALRSPTDMPVPTELPSPTSAVSEPMPTAEELITTAPPPTAPTALMEEAPPEAAFPPPMPESAPMSSSHVGSPSELPVPGDEATRRPRSVRKLRSPTEMVVPVPTEMPSPASHGALPEVPARSPAAMEAGLPQVYSSMVGMSSSAATQSPSELPVPTERPSPTELSARRPRVSAPVVAVESGMLGSSAFGSSAMASGQQRSPTEMPVPTDVPSPTTPCEDEEEGETVTAPMVTAAQTSSIERTLTHSRPVTSVTQTSPVDLPVPTARPSPTSMNEGDDEEEAIVGPLPDAALQPPEPDAFGIASPLPAAGELEIPARTGSALLDSALSESAPERTPTELPEDMPVPTEVPSPTSLRGEDEVDTLVEEVGTLPTQTLVPPSVRDRAAEDEANVPVQPSAAAGTSAFMSDSGQMPRSPTDMPVPTELPSPTSAVSEPMPTAEELLITTAPPPTAPTALMEEAPPEAAFPPPMPESAPMSSSQVGSPSELPVPGDEATRRPRSVRKLRSPTEMVVPVPTEMPSPASLGALPEVPARSPAAMGFPQVYSSMAGMSSSAATQSPSELPVPTERPSPTELSARRPRVSAPVVAVESGMLGSSAFGSSAMASGQQRSPTEMPVPTDVPSPTTPCEEEEEGETVTAPMVTAAQTSSIERTLTHSRPVTSVAQTSPVDLPVPTARPSPTSMNSGDDEEEAIVGPLPDAAMQPPEPDAFGIASPVPAAGELEITARTGSALLDSALSESAPERTPTELPEDMPVPTEVPSPTSLGAEDEVDTLVEEVVTLPTQTLVAPSIRDRAAEDEANVPVQASAAAGTSAFMSDSGQMPHSPTDMPVPTELPSPTSAEAEPVGTGEELVTTAPPPTAPTALVQEAPPDADFPPPMPESAAMSSSFAGSPSEMPVPTAVTEEEDETGPGSRPGVEAARFSPVVPAPGFAHAFSSAMGVSSSAATQSPSELPVPTERPSPTEMPVAARQRPAVPVVAMESAMLGSSGALASSGAASGLEHSPTEMPVPTDVPSPTTPCEDEGETITAPVTAEVHTRTLTAVARPARELVLSSPADLPVPTARPSPTSISSARDDEEAMLVPLPFATAAHEPPELGESAVHSPVVMSPVHGGGEIEVPEAGPAPAAPETSPVDVPVPTHRPSPTSLQEPGDQEEVASAPLMESAPPEEPTPTELPVPTDKSATERSERRRAPAEEISDIEAVPATVPRRRQRGGRPASPSEMLVPTEKPSPTSPGPVRTMTRTRTATHTGTEEVPTMSAPPPFASASQMMMSSSALTGSPTDMPVPTEMPSPARPSSDIEEATMALTETVLPTLPTQTAVAPEIEAPASQMMVSSSAAPGSPTDMPVPTEMPSPTSPGGDDDEDDTHTVETALPPTSSLGVPTLEVPTREMKKSAQMDASASQQMVSSSAVQASPTEMPVPTEVPSPTSPAGPEQEEAETIVTDTAPPPTRTLVAPTFEAALESAAISAQMDLDVPAPDESAVAGSAVMSDSGPGPRSPTDMPVPTDVPSPTSSAGDVQVVAEEADEDEAAPLVAPPLAPAELVEEAPPEADFPPPMPESAPMSSSAAGSPSELPVPVADSEEEEAQVRPRASPTEVAVMVPTEMPSPTSPHFARAPPEVVRPPSALPQEYSSAAALSSSAATQSPSELPVPTERPSPTEPPVPRKAKQPPVALESAMLASSAMASSALSSGAPQSPTEMPVPTDVPSPTTPCDEEGETLVAPTVPTAPTAQSMSERTVTAGSHPTALSSPADLPVPTARPSPTSMSPGSDDEEEAIVGPLPKAAMPEEPPELGVTAVVESPAETSPTEEAARVDIEVPEARPDVPAIIETSPADVPVPTRRPSPTSLNEACDEEEVASAPLMESAPPEEPTPTELPVPTDRSGTEKSQRKRAADESSEAEELPPPTDTQRFAKRRQQAQPRGPSPSELPVPTDRPSPTSPAALPTATAQREATATLTATREEEVPTRVPQKSSRPEASASAMMSSSAMRDSPTEMPVPTEVPSPTSPGGEEVATLVTDSALPPTRTVLQPGVEVSVSQMMASSSAQEESPTEMPVPTEMPSPTSPGGDEEEAETQVTYSALPPTQTFQLPSAEVPTRTRDRPASKPPRIEVEALPLSGMMSDSAPVASPTEMPVPTEVPSPTSPHDEEDEEAHTLVTETALPPTQVPVAPMPEAAMDSAVLSAQMDADVPMPQESAVMGSAAMSDSGPMPGSPSDMPVPTDVPSPTSSAGEEIAPTEDEEDAEPLVPPPAAPAAPVEEAPPDADFPPPMPESAPMSASHVASSPSELPVQDQVPVMSAKTRARSSQLGMSASGPMVSSSAAPRSPSELPVPTDKPSPTSPAARPLLIPTAAAGMLEVPADVLSPTSPAFEVEPSPGELEVPDMKPIPTVSVQATSPADLPLPEEATASPTVTKEAPAEKSPTELPVPATLMTAPSRKRAAEDSETETLPPPSAVPTRPAKRQQAASPSELPVPTERPSPTSLAAARTVTAATREATATLTREEEEVPTRVTARRGSQVDASASMQMVSSSAGQQSPTEMPVPTEVPTPTSPWGDEDEAETVVAATALPPTQTLAEPAPEAALDSAVLSAHMELDVPAPQESAVVESAAMSESAPEPRSPTDMPVPTDVPSPTSFAGEERTVMEEEAATTAPPPTAPPVALVEEAPPDADFPPPMPESAPMSSSMAASSPSEMPVPTEIPFQPIPPPRQAGSAQMVGSASAPVVSSSAAPQSPSELPVPTDKPSPTSPVVKPKAAAVAPLSAEASAPLVSSSAAPASPSELPVPTDRPSPTSPAARPAVLQPAAVPESAAAKMSASAAMDSSAALSSGQPESPTEMPVPTDVPSPTTPCEDEGETVTVPTAVPTAYTPTRTAPEATVPTAETLTRTFVEVEPTADAPTQSRTVPRTTARTSSRTATLTAPTVPRVTLRPRVAREAPTAEPPMEEVPAAVPSPTSPAEGPLRDEQDEVPLGPPVAAAVRAPPEVIPESEVPPPMQILRQPRSPTAPQVPTDVPSPTSPAVSSPPVEDDAEVEVPERPVPSLQETSPADLPVPEDEVASAPPMESAPPEPPTPSELPVPEDREEETREPQAEEAEMEGLVPPVRVARFAKPRPQAPAVPSPSELPVPTEKPSPTSLAAVPTVPTATAREATVTATVTREEEEVPTRVLPASARLEASASQPMASSSAAQQSPTEMPVPTEVPSPTSPWEAEDEAETLVTDSALPPTQTIVPPVPVLAPDSAAYSSMLEPDVPRSSAASAPPGVSVSGPGMSSSAVTRSPSELPVPTDKPSPTSLAVQPEPRVGSAVAPQSADVGSSQVMDSSAMMSSGQPPESPTEMPVPTDVPSPTSPREPEGETITAPTAIPTVETPTRTVAEGTIPTAETPTRTVVEAVAPTASPTRTAPEVPPTAETPTRTLVEAAPTVETPTQTRTVATARSTRTRPQRGREVALPIRRRQPEAPTVELPLEEVPVSAVPSPTSPAEAEDEEEAVPMHVPAAASRPRAPEAAAAEEPPVPLQELQQPRSPTAPEMEVPTDVPSPTSPADDDREVPTMPTAEPTLLPYEESVVAPTSPASPLAEDQALEGPPGQEDLRPWKRRKQRKDAVAGTSTPTRRRWSAPPVPGTPTEEAIERTPTEDALLVPPPARAGSAARASPTEAGESSTYLAQEAEEPLPATPTYTADSPEFQEENEPETPTLEPDDEELYAWEENLVKSGAGLPGIIVDVNLVRGGEPEPLDATQLAQLSPMELAQRLAAPGALLAARAQGLALPRTPAVSSTAAVVRLPGMEPPTPSYEPDQEDDDFQLLHAEPPEDVYVPPAAGSAAAAQADASRRRSQEEQLPPWKRRQRRRQE